jgi:hypothetical protein
MVRNGHGGAGLAPATLAALVLLGPAAASASTIDLSGSGTMSPTYQFLWSAPSDPTISNDYDLAVSGQYAFLDQFTSQQPESPNLGTSSVGAYDFQDSYRFTIGSGASGDSMVASLGLCNGNGCTFDIQNLQFRLYEVPSSTTAPVVGAIPTGPGYQTITSWMGPPAGQTSVSATFTNIQAGTYILDIAGIADGSSGGTYVGQLNLNAPAVPLPPSVYLLLSGAAVLGALTLRRRPASPLAARALSA